MYRSGFKWDQSDKRYRAIQDAKAWTKSLANTIATMVFFCKFDILLTILF